MSYWLYCQSCQKWSRSTSSISDDKSCSFCGVLYFATKSAINSAVDQEIAEKLRKTPQDIGSSGKTIRTAEPKKQEKPDLIESPPQPEITPVKVESGDPEPPALLATEDPKLSPEDEQVERREELESQGTSEDAGGQKDGQTTNIPNELEEEADTSDIPDELEEESDTTDIAEESEEDSDTSDIPEASEEDSDTSDIPEASEAEKTRASEIAKKPKMTRTREKYMEKKRRTRNFPDV